MLSRKAHLDSGEFSFTDQKKTTHFLSLVKKKSITHSLFVVVVVCGLLLAKKDMDVLLREAALQEMCSLVRMISQ